MLDFSRVEVYKAGASLITVLAYPGENDEQSEAIHASLCHLGALAYVCMDWRHIKELLAAAEEGYGELKNLYIWVKDNAGIGALYRSRHELIFPFKHSQGSHRNNVQLGRFGRNRSNVWCYPGINSFARSGGEGNLLALRPGASRARTSFSSVYSVGALNIRRSSARCASSRACSKQPKS